MATRQKFPGAGKIWSKFSSLRQACLAVCRPAYRSQPPPNFETWSPTFEGKRPNFEVCCIKIANFRGKLLKMSKYR
jgi:hypothetical protein